MASMAQAALLDELMGRNRNAAVNEKIKDPHWSDDDICKYFLCGFCPHDLFVNTKTDLGPCPNIHDESLRENYIKSRRYEKMGYEIEFVHLLNQLVGDVDRRIRRGHERLESNKDTDGPTAPLNILKKDKIDAMKKKIADLLVQAENLGSEGKVDQAQGVLKLCEQLKYEKAQIEGEGRMGQVIFNFCSFFQGKELEVCEICGAFRIKDDAPQRVEEHLAGKMHIGYAKIRDYLREYSEKRLHRMRKESPELSGSRERYQSRTKSPDRRRHSGRRSRSRDRDSRRYKDDWRRNEKSHRRNDSRPSQRKSDRHRNSSRRDVSPFSANRRLPEGADI